MSKTVKHVEHFAFELDNAYSSKRYLGGWSPTIKMLRRRGYDDSQIEAIIRSKWTRWAADSSGKSYCRNNSMDLARWMDNSGLHPQHPDVIELTKETFPESTS